MMSATEPEERAMSFKIDRKLLDAAFELGPLIAEYSAEGERDRRVPSVIIQAMKDAGLIRMMTPKTLGGLELDPVTSARVFEEIARFDSAASWVLQAANSGDFYCAMPTGSWCWCRLAKRTDCGARSCRKETLRLWIPGRAWVCAARTAIRQW
jgi:alkylation response protein AidB-like acyl-CoA dehydrogenase